MTCRREDLPTWDQFYRNHRIEDLLFSCATLDPDLDFALSRHDIRRGRVLDEGCGPGSQAILLAQRGFEVTAADISPFIVEYAKSAAREHGVSISCIVDNVLDSKLNGLFDVVFDRGCYHGLPALARARYVETVSRLTRSSGWLFLKAFSHLEQRNDGPDRFSPDDINRAFGSTFEVVDVIDTVYQGRFAVPPKALFCSLRRR